VLLLVGVVAGIVAVFEGLPTSPPEASGRAEVTDADQRIQDLERRIAQLEQQMMMLQDSATASGPVVYPWDGSTPEERHAIREAILEHWKPVPYTDQQLYETRAEGPSRPGCAGLRPRAGQLPAWLHASFLGAFGCATAEDRLNQLELQQRGIASSRQGLLWQHP
jgi:hypothetical protein